tara:strand:- start:1146 stop:1538 length:393 start_codon:yes stop_codon:yes gene_type:complete
MNLKVIFKKLILLDLSLLILIFISAFFSSEIVIAFNESISQSNNMNDMLGVIALVFLLLYILNLYLLYKFKNIGKQMYLFLFILGSIFVLLMGIGAYDPIFYLLDGLGWASSGAILVFLYFTPIKKEFEK